MEKKCSKKQMHFLRFFLRKKRDHVIKNAAMRLFLCKTNRNKVRRSSFVKTSCLKSYLRWKCVREGFQRLSGTFSFVNSVVLHLCYALLLFLFSLFQAFFESNVLKQQLPTSFAWSSSFVKRRYLGAISLLVFPWFELVSPPWFRVAPSLV